MADILLDTQSASATPAAGQSVLFPETTGKRWTYKDDAGRTYTLGEGCIRNQAVSSVTGYAADTYLAGSSITIPASLTLQAGTQYRCKISLNKTAVGTAAPVFNIRIGTAGTTADAVLATLTTAVQTAAADTGWLEILVTIRTVGAAATSQVTFAFLHTAGAAAGFGFASPAINEVAGTAFNSTTASLIIGISMNFGASANVTTTQVEAELLNI
jgi:hypothetical protein